MASKSGKLIFRVHAIKRMFQRGITPVAVKEALLKGKIIEDYPDDEPYPSRLVLGWDRDRPLHIVVAENVQAGENIIVTVYEPDSAQWKAGFEKRKN